ncbi:MAG: (Fe-S)-binding protein [Deltaproteobacteria bacterium]|nr:(Fe-S)-binding protein [Deltaproteobacteria bacterium]
MAEFPFLEVNEAIRLYGGEDLNACMQCGLCASICPWREVDSSFFARQMIRMGQLGLEGYESDEVLFGCTTCGKCVQNCPREVDIISIMRAMRAMVTEAGIRPETLKGASGSCHASGNPWSGKREDRLAWTKDLTVPTFGPETEYLLFVCCTSCYDQRSQKVAQSLVRLLEAAGVSYGIIGTEESCCGESIRKSGDEELFQKLAAANIALFQREGVRKIITTSPHCLKTFTSDYPALGGQYEVVHSSQLLAHLAAAGKLPLQGREGRKVAFHDPCYLGRHSQVFDEPRQLVAATGAELVAMPREKSFSLCCGGGGGRVWMETPQEQRFSILRVQEAAQAGAEVLATSCPYCLSLLEDSRKTAGLEDSLEVVEVSELLARDLG